MALVRRPVAFGGRRSPSVAHRMGCLTSSLASRRSRYGAGMRVLWPDPNADSGLNTPPDAATQADALGRPWVTMIMIESIDGAIDVDGVSGSLGGPADRDWFIAARRQSEAIIVGATTATVERYQPTTAPVAIITGSLSMDPAADLFVGAPEQSQSLKPLLYTTTQAAQSRGQIFDGIAEVIDLGDSVDPAAVLADLHQREISRVLLEGGPTVNGLFLSADLVDEVLLTLSPLVVGGDGPRLTRSQPLLPPARYTLDHVATADDLLFLRYLRAR